MEIIPIHPQHISRLVQLSDQAFGSNYLNSNYFKTTINSPSDFGFVIKSKDGIMGYIFSSIVTNQEINTHLLKGGNTIANQLKGKTTIIKHVAINGNYQKQGLGQQLIEHTLNQLKNNCEQFICVSWKKGATTPMSQLLIKSKFSLLDTINNYWLEDSISKKFPCPICGNPCKCSADIFIKKAA